VCCTLSLGLLLLALVVSLPYGDPNAPPLIQILGSMGMMMVLPAWGLVGAISMLKRKRYNMAVIGAICMLVPLLGPCFGLTLPVGIWSLVLLRRKSVREAFIQPNQQMHDACSSVDDTVAAASNLDKAGDWDAAIELYRTVAARWPEHKKYAEACIDEIVKKQNAADR
jgi:hypothetical protein